MPTTPLACAFSGVPDGTPGGIISVVELHVLSVLLTKVNIKSSAARCRLQPWAPRNPRSVPGMSAPKLTIVAPT